MRATFTVIYSLHGPMATTRPQRPHRGGFAVQGRENRAAPNNLQQTIHDSAFDPTTPTDALRRPMLTRLRLKNFKSWADTEDIPLRPITGVFGANSSGKTSLLQALLLLKQTSESADRGLVFHFGDKTTPVDLGDFRSVVYAHDAACSLEFSLDWISANTFDVIDTKNGNKTVVDSNELGFSVSVKQAAAPRTQRLIVDKMFYRVGNAVFGMRRQERKSKIEHELFSDGTEFRFIHSVGRKWPLPPPIKSYGFPDQVRAYFQNAGFVADLELALEERLHHIYYLGPLRAYPERRYTWSGTQPIDMGRAGESVVEALLASQERGETISPGYKRRHLSLEEYVAQWLQRLGLIHEFRVVPLGEGNQIFQVMVRRSPTSAEVLITDVGFGVSQILPVLVLCFYVPEGSTVILEQPEIHLHPAVQSGLADVLIDAWKKRKVQIILESHSEHLLRRLQRRVADETIDSSQLSLYFCEARLKGSSLVHLDVDLFGNIRNWPEDFFGDQFSELAATQESRVRRMKG